MYKPPEGPEVFVGFGFALIIDTQTRMTVDSLATNTGVSGRIRSESFYYSSPHPLHLNNLVFLFTVISRFTATSYRDVFATVWKGNNESPYDHPSPDAHVESTMKSHMWRIMRAREWISKNKLRSGVAFFILMVWVS